MRLSGIFLQAGGMRRRLFSLFRPTRKLLPGGRNNRFHFRNRPALCAQAPQQADALYTLGPAVAPGEVLLCLFKGQQALLLSLIHI